MKKLLLVVALSSVTGLSFAATANMAVSGSVSAPSTITVNDPLALGSAIITDNTQAAPVTYTLNPQTGAVTLTGGTGVTASGTPSAGDFTISSTPGAVTQVGLSTTVNLTSAVAGATAITLTPTFIGDSGGNTIVDVNGQTSCSAALLNGGNACQYVNNSNPVQAADFIVGGFYSITPNAFTPGGAYTGTVVITTTDM